MSKEIEQYKNIIIDIFNHIEKEEESIKKAAKVISNAIIKDQLIHVMGTGGHSNMGAEETLWRTGGLVPINAILDAGTNLIHGAKRSNIVERTPGYAISVLDAYEVGKKEGEVIIIVNAYGINSMTIDTVLEARKRKMITIGVTSKSFAKVVPFGHPSRHSSNKNLYEEVDIFINNYLPEGDAVVDVDSFPQKIAPTSTFCNSFALNLIVIETVKELVRSGVTPPVWMSANMPGGDEANEKYEQAYFNRIKHLR
jgi:uncharacterized phosphosugar-binding protein